MPPDPDDLFRSVDFSGRARIIVAVSGGGDSLALLLLLRDHLKSCAVTPSLLAVTIDHGLRPESREEAQQVAHLCRQWGIAHRTLHWGGAKPGSGVSEAAREARFDLLAQAAEDAGTDLVLTGHTGDDQAETLAMRRARGRGRGLAGIAPATLYNNRVWFLRPLLTERRASLRTFLRERAVAWIEDPTNRDQRFERVRLRQSLSEDEIGRLLKQAEEEAAMRETAGREAAATISRFAEEVAPGLFRLDKTGFNNADGDTALYALRILLAVAGGTPHLPSENRAGEILSQATAERARVTLSRSIVAARGPLIYLHRENRNLPQTSLTAEMLWDGRYRIVPSDDARNLTITPFGSTNAQSAKIGGFDAPSGLVRSALAAQPALRSEGAWVGLAASSVVVHPVAGPWSRLLPSFDLAPANAIRALIGGKAIPELPLQRHKKLMT
ncbi:tRNA lysidine(34) synthetase TilS [Chelativorans sp. YIM 93263]|uniref:tRNA lysidine(34) synthetase TilS n=1 Tax=Chelativorans sp. YIM 93263 TaxID=2906648 RepID=UPI002379FB20|nr:tRNA lysidine(34) synthetase TilS [Chelativorans sp. YIM 93263]